METYNIKIPVVYQLHLQTVLVFMNLKKDRSFQVYEASIHEVAVGLDLHFSDHVTYLRTSLWCLSTAEAWKAFPFVLLLMTQ